MSDFGDQFGIFQILNVWFVLCYGCFFLKDAFFSHFLLAPSCYLLKSSACEEFAGLSSMLPLSESSAVGNLGEFRLGAVAAPVCCKFSSLGLGAKWAAASTTLACFDHRTCGNTLQWWMLVGDPWISTACFAYLHRVALFQKMPQYHPLHYMSQEVSQHMSQQPILP